MVERTLGEREAAGSIPVTPTDVLFDVDHTWEDDGKEERGTWKKCHNCTLRVLRNSDSSDFQWRIRLTLAVGDFLVKAIGLEQMREIEKKNPDKYKGLYKDCSGIRALVVEYVMNT